MARRDFYRLTRLTALDLMVIDHYIERSATTLAITHQNLVNTFVRITEGNEIIQRSDASEADKLRARDLVIETEENLHSQIELSAIPILDKLRQNTTQCIDSYDNAIKFYHFIAQQYFRTKRIREAIGDVLAQISPDHDFSHLKHIICHIGAVNFGGSLFVDRNEFDVVLFETNQHTHFITGDQPIVNLLG